MRKVNAENIKREDGFWRFYMDLNRNAIVKNVYDRFAETDRLMPFTVIGTNCIACAREEK